MGDAAGPSIPPDAALSPRRGRAAILLFLAAGLLAAHHPLLLSGFRRTQGNLGDARMVNYILEHEYRWLIRRAGHERLWSPPVFHPAPNTLAYSETLLGAAPLYWVPRLAGFAPDTAYQLWLLAVSCLNYLAAFALLRRGFRFDLLPSCLGGALFAFANARIAHIGHPQLLPGFYLPLALLGAGRILGSPPPSGRRERVASWALFSGCVAAQVYTCFYTAWFFLLGLTIAVVAGASLSALRPRLLAVLRGQALFLLVSLFGAGLAVLPLATHYLSAAAEVGYREYAQVVPLLPRPQSWFFSGPQNWMYGWMSGLAPFRSLPAPYEQAIGFGFLTAALATAGLVLRRSTPAIRVLLLAAAATILLVTLWPGDLSLWKGVFHAVPGAGAVRAVARGGGLLLLPVAIGAAAFAQAAPWRRRWVWAACVACLAEQGATTETYDKIRAREEVAAVARSVDPRCAAFIYSVLQPGVPDWAESVPIKYHLDAMWAQLELGIPTLNGYSGHVPPGWAFKRAIVSRTPEENARLSELLREWLAGRGLDPARVCWTTADLSR